MKQFTAAMLATCLTFFLCSCQTSSQPLTSPANDERSTPVSAVSSTNYNSGEYQLLQITCQDGPLTTIIITPEGLSQVAYQCGFPIASGAEAQEYIKSHPQPLSLPPEFFAKLKNYAAPAVDPKLSQLTVEEITEKFLQEEDRHYVLKNFEDRRDSSLLRLLLEKNFAISNDCYSGSLRITPPPAPRRQLRRRQ